LSPEEDAKAADRGAQHIVRIDRDARTETLLRLQRAAGNASVSALLEEEGAAAASSVKQVLGSGTGRPLDDTTREAMEARLGQDFSGVKIHSDSKASQSASAVNASAYTVGNQIVLGEGVSPDTEAGQRTLAHELTHVAQQRSGPVAGTPMPGGISVSDPGDRFEQEAARTASQAVASGGAAPSGVGAPTASMQREEEEQGNMPTVQREPPASGISPGKLQLDPDIQAEILRIQIEQLLHPTNVLSALQNIHLNLAEPAPGGAFDFKPAPKEEPLVTPGPGPDTPKAGSPDDVLSAILKVKAVDNAVSRLRLDASDRVKHDWRSLSGGEKAAVVITSVLIGGAAIGGVASDPKSREWALQQLDGKEAPVPGISGLSIQFNRPDPHNVGVMLKFDVGSHLPKSLGFGSGD
jgi:hypothetical protein